MASETNLLLGALAIVFGVLIIIIPPLLSILAGVLVLAWGIWTLVKEGTKSQERKTA